MALDLKFPIQAIEKERKKWPLRNGLKLKNNSKEHLFWFLNHLVTQKKKSMQKKRICTIILTQFAGNIRLLSKTRHFKFAKSK